MSILWSITDDVFNLHRRFFVHDRNEAYLISNLFVSSSSLLRFRCFAVPPELIDLHIRLMRKARKNVNPDRWQRTLAKFCYFSLPDDCWQLEQKGYKELTRPQRLRILVVSVGNSYFTFQCVWTKILVEIYSFLSMLIRNSIVLFCINFINSVFETLYNLSQTFPIQFFFVSNSYLIDDAVRGAKKFHCRNEKIFIIHFWLYWFLVKLGNVRRNNSSIRQFLGVPE